VKSAGPRITGGTARGAKLFSVPGLDVRPALARMRVSVFEILRPRLEGARVLDLFAGTGCLGLESLSRGAREAVFLDVDRRALDAVRRNLEKLRFADRGVVRNEDAFRAAGDLGPADLAFVDPPYRFFVERAAEMRALVGTLLSRVLAPGGRVVVEHRPKEGLGEVVGGTLVDERTYGGTLVTFYARASEPGEAAKSTVSG
jgi:16S rRNA (guanine(966)-N(2))-methyltransferase RsmD